MLSRAVRRPRSARPTIADRMAAIDPRLLRLLDLLWLILLGRGWVLFWIGLHSPRGMIEVVFLGLVAGVMPTVGWLLLRWRPHLIWLVIFLIGAVMRTALMDHLMGVVGIALMLLLGGVRWGAVHLGCYLALEFGSLLATGVTESWVYMCLDLASRVTIQYTIGVVLWRCQVRVQRLRAERAALAERRNELLANARMRADLWLLAGRGRAAAALHDGLGQQLALAGMLLDYAARTGLDGPDGRREVAHSRQILADAADNVGGWLAGDSGPQQRGLASWLELAAAYQGTPMEVSLDLPAEPIKLDAEQSEYVTRFLAEGLTNAWRHGRATRVWASAHVSGDALLLEVADNGTAGPTAGSGFGLLGLGSDATALGGRFSAGAAETGWRNTAQLPRVRSSRPQRRNWYRPDERTLPAWSRDPTVTRFMASLVVFSLFEGLVQLVPHNAEYATRMQGFVLLPIHLWLGYLALVALGWLVLRLSQAKVSLAVFLVLAFLGLAVGQAPIYWLGAVLVFALFPARRAWWYALAGLAMILVVTIAGTPDGRSPGPIWVAGHLAFAIGAGVLGMGVRYLLDIGERLEASNQELVVANSDIEQAHQLEIDLASATERAAVAERLYGAIGRRLDDTAAQLADVDAGSNGSGLEQAREQVALLLADVRLWARALSPLRPESTWRDLRTIAARFRGTGVAVQVELPDAEPGLRPEVSVALVRMVQETLASAIQDRGASTVEIDVSLDGDQLLVAISDDGSQLEAGSLVELARRLEALGGSLDSQTGPSGCSLLVSLPLDAELGVAQPA